METENLLENLKYPIGKFQKPTNFNLDLLSVYIKTIEDFPTKLKSLTQNIGLEQLNFQYRPNGWSVKQVIHHCADSHINAFVRIKLALTEHNPSICPYNEVLWANLCDSTSDNVLPSIQILEGIHNRWVSILKSLSKTDFEKTYFHPGSQTNFSIFDATAMYDWHCRHHLKHIENGIQSNGKYQNL